MAIVHIVSSVNELFFVNSSNLELFELLNSKREPTISPIIAPNIIRPNFLYIILPYNK